MKVYISGKIGEEVLSEGTREKFAKAEAYLKGWDFEVFNPTTSGLGERAEELAKVNGTDFYTEIMKLDLAELERCDAIYLLTDWTDSPGAKKELSRAKELGLAVWYECGMENFCKDCRWFMWVNIYCYNKCDYWRKRVSPFDKACNQFYPKK